MTRREALTAVVATVAGHLGESQQRLSFSAFTQPTTLTFNLASYATYTFREGDRTATFTPKELMDAITHVHTFAPSSDVLLKFRGAEFEPCLGCGELVRKR